MFSIEQINELHARQFQVMSFVHVGEYAGIHRNPYPNVIMKGQIQNIAPTLDPNCRTAKARLEVDDPGLPRFGMFVAATFHGMQKEMHATVPATTILHLHDRGCIYSLAGRLRNQTWPAGDHQRSRPSIYRGAVAQ